MCLEEMMSVIEINGTVNVKVRLPHGQIIFKPASQEDIQKYLGGDLSRTVWLVRALERNYVEVNVE